MVLYIIRHADPDYENDTITEFGRQEAAALADWLKDMPLDRIYTSPLGRAIDTARPTCEVKGMDMTVLPWTRESMNYMQSHQLTPESICSYKFSVQKGIYDFEDFLQGDRMNTIEAMQKASDDFLESLGYVREGVFYRVQENNEEHIAVFCHGGFGCAWISHLLSLPIGLIFPAIKLNTTSVTTIHFQKAESGYIRPCLKHLGEIHHIRNAKLRVND